MVGIAAVVLLHLTTRDYEVPSSARDTPAELAGTYVGGPCRLVLHEDLTYDFTWADGATTGTYDIENDPDMAITVHGFRSRYDGRDISTIYNFAISRSIMPLYAYKKMGRPMVLQIYVSELEQVNLERVETRTH